MRTALIAISMLLGGWAAQGQPSVALQAVTEQKYYRQNARSEVHLGVRVRANPDAPPPPVVTRNVVLVLDRSGSMAGAPIQALRQATVQALAQLAPDDFVAVVGFGSEVETVIEAQRFGDVRDLAGRIARLEPAGGAALYDALNQAAAQLRRHGTATTTNQLILVTDGPPTKGPREAEDFVRLAEVFAGEGMIFSTVGLGEDFNEDLLAELARTGHGRFLFADGPEKLPAALQAQIGPPSALLGVDAELTVEFRRGSDKVEAHSWPPAVISGTTITHRFPRLLSTHEPAVLVSAEVDAFATRFDLSDFARVRLRWKRPGDLQPQETSQLVRLDFSDDGREVRESLEATVARLTAAVIIRDGLQHAIEQLDKKDPRRALRVLRSARSDARDLNFDLADAAIDEQLRVLEAYLTATSTRTLGPLDRKILRSGLFNAFDPPAAAAPEKN